MSRQLRGKVRSLPLAAAGLLALALALFVAACNKGSGAPPPPLFNAPGDIDMVCFDRQYDPKGAPARSPVVLPRHCCDSSYVYYDAGVAGEDEACRGRSVRPGPHALLTQTLRGELAAVDLIEDEVIDGLRSIPGYTFVDVGGEPTAVVVPPAFPCPTDASPAQKLLGCGAPVFTYVSGREQDEVRAISTCRFRLGRECGPDKQTMEVEDDDAGMQEVTVPRASQKVVPLVGAPGDMVLDPNGRALWISLPERGLLARVALATHDPNDDGALLYPFELDENDVPKPAEYFPLSSGIDLAPPEPVLEPEPYLFTCGLGYSFDPMLDRLKLPIAPRMTSSKQAHPTRMMLADLGDADGSKTLLVVDDGQGVVHALSLGDAAPTVRAVMPVGAPLRDFAVTPGVPMLTPPAKYLVSTDFYYAKSETPPSEDDPDAPPDPDPDPRTIEDTKRYLYGIDARDGSLMAFDLSLNAGTPALTPLRAPAPARDVLRRFANFDDRLGVGGDGSFSARTLTVIDTRRQLLPDGSRDTDYCGQFDSTTIEDGKKASKEGSAERALWTYREDVLNTGTDDRAYEALRGVYLLVSGSSGVMAVIDVHNLDLQCRARANCDPKDTNKLSTNSQANGVALQRHAVRLSGIEAASANISSSDDLEQEDFRFGLSDDAGAEGGAGEPDAGDQSDAGDQPEEPPELDAGGPTDDGGEEPDAGDGGEPDAADGVFDRNEDGCPIGYYRVVDSPALLCAAANPWRSRPATWTVTYRGALIPSLFSAALDEGENEGEILMQAPQGLDFCERGVEPQGLESREDGVQRGSALAIVSEPEDHTPDYCDRDSDDPWRLLVKEAYQDHLVLEIADEVTGPSGDKATLEDLRACFSDFSEFQLRLADAWRVQMADNTYTHRVMTGPDGVCVIDPEIDRRWEARAEPAYPYVDSYVAFQLREPERANDVDAKEARSPSISLDLLAAPLTLPFTTGPRFDTLPVRMRSFPESGYTFIVDGASQGITSLTTFPTLEVDESYH